MPIDWSAIGAAAPAAITVIKDIALAGAAISTAVVGWIALGRWRQEAMGKRRLELAEEVLASFYQVAEIIHDVRTPFVDAREVVREPNVPEEISKKSAYGPIRRLQKQFDKILDLRVKRHRFAAVFGPQSTKSWDEIESVLSELDAASQALLHPTADDVGPNDPDAGFYRDQRRILFRGLGEDPIAPRVKEAVQEIETICRPIIATFARPS